MRLHRYRCVVACAASLAAGGAVAEPVLPEWFTYHPGSTVQGGSRVQVHGNTATADIAAGGGGLYVAGGLGGSVELPGAVQANGIDLSALDVTDARLGLLANRAEGFVSAIGGAASANAMLLSGGGSRRALAHSDLQLRNNTAADVQANGGRAQLLVGAASLEMAGRASANSLQAEDSALRNARVDIAHNQARDVSSLGGAALANATSVVRGDVDGLQVVQGHNRATGVRAGGVNASLGWDVLGELELRGVAGANAVLLRGETRAALVGLALAQQRNSGDAVSAFGGSALANSVQVQVARDGALRGYGALQQDNQAREVHALGAQASMLGGALFSLQAGAVALANSVSLADTTLAEGTRHVLSGNQAERVQAVGGAALANSLWLQQSQTRASPVALLHNSAQDIDTSAGGISIGMGSVIEFQRNGRSLANSVALEGNATLNDSPTVLMRNSAATVRGEGGVAAANAVVVSGGAVQGTRLALIGNDASAVQSTGFKGSVGAGLLFATNQQALVLANSLGVFGSSVDAAGLMLAHNRASALSAQGGKIMANSVSVEAEGGASRLSARTSLRGNTAQQASTGASNLSGPAHVYSEESKARAALNAVVLHNNAEADVQSVLDIAHNQAALVGALGGTALVNSIAAYRGARIGTSTIALGRNEANDVRAGGSYAQVLGVGKARNGVLVANGLYMEGPGGSGVQLHGATVGLQGNVAQSLDANGGRLNANALAINSTGAVHGASIAVRGNRAATVTSQGEEDAVAGYAFNGGVGYTNANAVQVLGALRGGSLALLDNVASNVSAVHGVALANSVALQGDTQALRLRSGRNTADDVFAQDGHKALAASVLNEGQVDDATVSLHRNAAGARAEDDDAMAASVRNRGDGRIGGASRATLAHNRGQVRGRGTLNALDNHGQIDASHITILRNQGSVQDGGIVNSVVNGGRIGSSRVVLLGNTGRAERGGVVNSVVNGPQGEMNGARITLVGNTGTARQGGIVNSVDNRKLLTGEVLIANNRGTAERGGIANSLVNEGRMTGRVVISGNTGSASDSGIANSVINRGDISGTVTIHGSTTTAGAGQTTGSQRFGGAGVVQRTVTVGAGGVSYGS